MSLVFDLAAAINIGLGVAGGSSVKPLEEKVSDLAFRLRLAREAKKKLPELKQVSERELVRLFGSPSFLHAALTGDLTSIKPNDPVIVQVESIGSKVEPSQLPSLGKRVGEIFKDLALRDADPVERILYEELKEIRRRQDEVHNSQFKELGDLRGTLMQLSSEPRSEDGNKTLLLGNVPILSKWFVGREDILSSLDGARLHTGLAKNALIGAGGVGKSMLAAKYVRDHFDDFGVICWIPADMQSRIVDTLCILGNRLGISWTNKGNPKSQVREVLDRLANLSDKWLLVYDNAPDRFSVEEWLPSGGDGQLLITSRNAHFEDIADIHQVEPLRLSEGKQFLAARTRVGNPKASQDAVGLGEVAVALDGLPLALEQAGAYMARSSLRTWDKYRGLLKRVDLEAAFPALTKPAGYPETLLSTWAVSIEAADAEHPLARFILQVLSRLAPALIPMRFLETLESSSGGDVTEAITALHAYSLLRIEGGAGVSVHRLVQAVTSFSAPPATLDTASAAVILALPTSPSIDAEAWRSIAELEPHLTHLLHGSIDSVADVELRWDLIAKATMVAEAIAQWRSVEQSADLLEVVAHFATRTLGEYDLNALRANKNWATALAFSGKLADSVRILEKILESLQSKDDVPSDDLSETLRALILAYSRSGMLKEAADTRLMLHEAIPIDDESSAKALMRKSDLAFQLHREGRDEQAYEIFQEVVPQLSSLVGLEHPQTMKARQGLALLTGQLGNLASSKEMLMVLLDSKERVLGELHLSTLTTKYTLAATIQELDGTAAAFQVIKEVARDAERALGSKHPFTLDARHAVATSLGELGQTDDAVRYLVDIHQEATTEYGPDNPTCLNIGTNLAAAYIADRKHVEGIQLLKDIVEREKRLFGSDHPTVEFHLFLLEQWTHQNF